MLTDKNRLSLFSQLADDLQQLFLPDRIELGHGFIEENDLWFPDQLSGNAGPILLPHGELLNRRGKGPIESNLGKSTSDKRCHLFRSDAEVFQTKGYISAQGRRK